MTTTDPGLRPDRMRTIIDSAEAYRTAALVTHPSDAWLGHDRLMRAAGASAPLGRLRKRAERCALPPRIDWGVQDGSECNPAISNVSERALRLLPAGKP